MIITYFDRGAEVKCNPQLYSEFETSLGCMNDSPKKRKKEH